jgi:hypothetical protein
MSNTLIKLKKQSNPNLADYLNLTHDKNTIIVTRPIFEYLPESSPNPLKINIPAEQIGPDMLRFGSHILGCNTLILQYFLD